MGVAYLGRKFYPLGETVVSKVDNAISFQQQALGLRAYRQQVLAANIANADTPNYKARDFDFAATLKDAIAGRSSGALAMDRTNSGHMSGTAGSESVRLMYRTPAQASADGNTVEMDAERSAFSENAIQYEAGITFISHQLKMIQSAIQTQS
nr:flagellar basal body rod protein FlgB [Propionivibrio soli]